MTATRSNTPTRTATRTRTATATNTPIPTAPPTPTLAIIGGEITAFGVARADGRVIGTIGPEDHGYLTYVRPASGFMIFLEAKPGISRRRVGTITFNSDPDDPAVLPQFQIVASRALGNGSAMVCDDGPLPMLGGVPAVNPAAFGGSQSISNAINDLSCRFDARGVSTSACTRDPFQQDGTFVGQGSTVQFCTSAGVGTELAFRLGDTILTARVLDELGFPGPPASIVIRVFAN